MMCRFIEKILFQETWSWLNFQQNLHHSCTFSVQFLSWDTYKKNMHNLAKPSKLQSTEGFYAMLKHVAFQWDCSPRLACKPD